MLEEFIKQLAAGLLRHANCAGDFKNLKTAQVLEEGSDAFVSDFGCALEFEDLEIGQDLG